MKDEIKQAENKVEILFKEKQAELIEVEKKRKEVENQLQQIIGMSTILSSLKKGDFKDKKDASKK